ncbi:MAG: hypothetical protein Kow0092_17460 [Deferrisomatales bacterium]
MDPHAEYFALARECLLEPPTPALVEALGARARRGPQEPIHPDFDRGWERWRRFFAARQTPAACADAAEAHRALLSDPLSPRLQPYASWYRDGHRLGEALVGLRGFLAQWRLAADRARFRDLEDHAAFLFDCLYRLRELEASEGPSWTAAYGACLHEHVLPWMPRFLQDLEREDATLACGGFYGGLAQVLLGILALEASSR